MENATGVGFLAILLVILNVLNLYNTAHTAHKNASEPYERLEKRVSDIERDSGTTKYILERIKADVDSAHSKIRNNENETKKQNQALLAILIWIKSNADGDTTQIDNAIKAIS